MWLVREELQCHPESHFLYISYFPSLEASRIFFFVPDNMKSHESGFPPHFVSIFLGDLFIDEAYALHF
jgi:hypothetical protein